MKKCVLRGRLREHELNDLGQCTHCRQWDAIVAMKLARLRPEVPETLEELYALYQRTHAVNPKRFLGGTTKLYVDPIKRLIEETGARTLLDYGSGKGCQYIGERRIHERWGGILPRCYDPGVPGLDDKPGARFDGVICCDVMEHQPEHLVADVLLEIFGYAERFVFLGICTIKSHKTLTDGTPAHLTVKDSGWWTNKIAEIASEVCWEAWFTDGKKNARRS